MSAGCSWCDGTGLVMVGARMKNGRWVSSAAPCWECPTGWRKHGERGRTCNTALVTRKTCPWCGAEPEETVPHDFAGCAYEGETLKLHEVSAWNAEHLGRDRGSATPKTAKSPAELKAKLVQMLHDEPVTCGQFSEKAATIQQSTAPLPEPDCPF